MDENLPIAGGVLVIAGLLAIVLANLQGNPILPMVAARGLAMIVGILLLIVPRRYRT